MNCTSMLWLLNSFEWASCGWWSRKRYTKNLLLMYLQLGNWEGGTFYSGLGGSGGRGGDNLHGRRVCLEKLGIWWNYGFGVLLEVSDKFKFKISVFSYIILQCWLNILEEFITMSYDFEKHNGFKGHSYYHKILFI